MNVRSIGLLLAVASAPFVASCLPPGVVLRFDDVHPVGVWRELVDAFDAEGMKASLAVPIGEVRAEHVEFLRRAQAHGHELMDHTHDHATYSHFCQDAGEFARACRLPFVAETNGEFRLVGFRFSFDRGHAGNFAFCGYVTNGVLVVSREDARRLHRPNKVYVPSLGRHYGFFDSPDGRIALRSFYTYRIEEKVDAPPGELLLCDHRAFSLSDDAVRYQADCSRRAFRRLGLADPRTWIQPGGWDAWLPADQFVRVYAKEFGYVAADCLPGASAEWNGDPKAPDPNVARFCFRPESYFDSAAVTPADVRKKILEAQSRGRGICFLSHMAVPPTMKGGRAEWMDETRSLLRWLKERRIPVRTFAEMAETLWGRWTPTGGEGAAARTSKKGQ